MQVQNDPLGYSLHSVSNSVLVLLVCALWRFLLLTTASIFIPGVATVFRAVPFCQHSRKGPDRAPPWAPHTVGTSVSLCGSLLCSKLSRAPPLTDWCPEWSALPSSKSALHATWTDLCSLPNTTSFWFCSCCSILPAHLPPNSYCHNAIASQGLSSNPLLPWRGPQLILHQVIPLPVASCLTFSDLRACTPGAVWGPGNLQRGSLLLHPAAGGLASSEVQGG